MKEMVSIDRPTDCIVAFKADINHALAGRTHTVCYQVRIDPADLSPSGDFIRFNFSNKQGETISELHGWKLLDEIEIMEVLKVHEQEQPAEKPIVFGAEEAA